MKNKIVSTLLITNALLVVGNQSCVFASETVVTTTETTTSPSTTIVVPNTVTTIPGSVVYFRTASPTVLITTIEGRRRDLERSIDQSCQSGQISHSQADAMKAELRRIASETGSNTISYPAAVMFAQDLDSIDRQYRTIVTTAPVYAPIITQTTFTTSTKQVYALDDLSARRANLEGRITKAVLQGRLSTTHAVDLRQQLANIGNEANNYTASGQVDVKESRRLFTEFDHVASEIEKWAGKDKDPV